MSDIPPPPPGHQPPGPPPSPDGSATPPPPPSNMGPPPGYVAYGSAPTPTQNVSRVGGLSTAITIVIAIAGLGTLANGLIQASLQSKAVDFLDGTLSRSEFEDTVVSSSAISAVAGVGTLAGGVLVMIWMYRISSNLRKYGMSTTWHPLFAIFGWILPPILFIIPMLMFREQWAKSAPPTQSGVVSSGSKENTALTAWWVFFALVPTIMLVVTANSMFSGFGDTSTEAVAERLADTGATSTMIGAGSSVIAAIAFIMFARQLTARHRMLTGER